MHDTELCKARTGTPANHCWHDTGVALTSYPAKTEQVCCWCGQKRHLQLMQWGRVIGNHGTNLPYYTKLDAVGTDGCKSAAEIFAPHMPPNRSSAP